VTLLLAAFGTKLIRRRRLWAIQLPACNIVLGRGGAPPVLLALEIGGH